MRITISTSLPALHQIAVEQYRAGSAHRWRSCLAASCIVGQYERGASLALASDLCLSVSQVENLAHAGWGWRTFRKYGVTSATRNQLTPSHFCAMFDLWREYEFDPVEAAFILAEAAEIGASVASMRQYVEQEYGPDRGEEWARRLKRIVSQVEKLITDYGVPDGVREAAKVFIGAVEHEADHHHRERAAQIVE